MIEDFKPTVLIVRQHNKTGKKYLHKTNRLDSLESYFGSGPHWKNHLKKHGKDVSVLSVSEIFTDKEEVEEFSLFLSEELNIVHNEEWANKIPENGLGGQVKGFKHSEESKKKIGSKIRGTKQTLKVKQKISEGVKKSFQNRMPWNKNKKLGPNPTHSKFLKELYKDEEWQRTTGIEKKEKCRKARIKNNPGFKQTVCCPYCQKKGQQANMKRWHFENCKEKK